MQSASPYTPFPEFEFDDLFSGLGDFGLDTSAAAAAGAATTALPAASPGSPAVLLDDGSRGISAPASPHSLSENWLPFTSLKAEQQFFAPENLFTDMARVSSTNSLVSLECINPILARPPTHASSLGLPVRPTAHHHQQLHSQQHLHSQQQQPTLHHHHHHFYHHPQQQQQQQQFASSAPPHSIFALPHAPAADEQLHHHLQAPAAPPAKQPRAAKNIIKIPKSTSSTALSSLAGSADAAPSFGSSAGTSAGSGGMRRNASTNSLCGMGSPTAPFSCAQNVTLKLPQFSATTELEDSPAGSLTQTRSQALPLPHGHEDDDVDDDDRDEDLSTTLNPSMSSKRTKNSRGAPPPADARKCGICLTPKRRIYRYLGSAVPLCNACNQHWRRNNHTDCVLCTRLVESGAATDMRGHDADLGKTVRERKHTATLSSSAPY